MQGLRSERREPLIADCVACVEEDIRDTVARCVLVREEDITGQHIGQALLSLLYISPYTEYLFYIYLYYRRIIRYYISFSVPSDKIRIVDYSQGILPFMRHLYGASIGTCSSQTPPDWL